jgi:hypothetical protein
MKLKEIHRTSTFAWSPYASLPLLATGTVAGALDASFSNDSQLEIWAPNFIDRDEYDLGRTENPPPKATVTTSSRFCLLALIVLVLVTLIRDAGSIAWHGGCLTQHDRRVFLWLAWKMEIWIFGILRGLWRAQSEP